MSYEISMTGLFSSQDYLDTTANNISNAATIGYKRSRIQFGDVHLHSVYSAPNSSAGQGAADSSILQQFSQGDLRITDNTLDVAVQGDGFFTLSKGQSTKDLQYTRAGAFRLNANREIVNSAGEYLMSYPVETDKNAPNFKQTTSLDLKDVQTMQVERFSGLPKMTNNIDFSVNFPVMKEGEAKSLSKFDPKDSKTYNFATSTSFFDSLGRTHILQAYYLQPAVERPSVFLDKPSGQAIPGEIKSMDASQDQFAPNGVPRPDNLPGVTAADANNGNQLYVAFYQLDNEPIMPAGRGFSGWNFNYKAKQNLTDITVNDVVTQNDLPVLDNGNRWIPDNLFISNGQVADHTVSFEQVNQMDTPPGNYVGANTSQALTLNYENSKMFDSPFQVYKDVNDGQKVGSLLDVSVAADGLIQAEYDNGDLVPVGRIAMVRFNNTQGLIPIGESNWVEGPGSGKPLAGNANSLGFGSFLSGSLEESNVNISQQMIDLIIAQRNYQASAKSLETNNALQNAVLQIR